MSTTSSVAYKGKFNFHHAENAKNDLNLRNKIKTQLCTRPRLGNGLCAYGTKCFYAHKETEIRKQKCKFMDKCRNKDKCQFDHTLDNVIPELPVFRPESTPLQEYIEENKKKHTVDLCVGHELVLEFDSDSDEEEVEESESGCQKKEDTPSLDCNKSEEGVTNDLVQNDEVDVVTIKIEQMVLKETIEKQNHLHVLSLSRKAEYLQMCGKKWYDRYFNLYEDDVHVHVSNTLNEEEKEPTVQNLRNKRTAVILLNYSPEESEDIQSEIQAFLEQRKKRKMD